MLQWEIRPAQIRGNMSRVRTTDWSQIIGTIAVVLGLLLVWEELRTTRQAMERQAVAERYAALAEPFFESTEILSASAKVEAVDGPGEIEAAFMETYGHTPGEAEVWTRHLYQVWAGVFADWDFGDRDVAEAAARTFLQSPDSRIFAELTSWGEGELATLIEDELARYR
jgi:hypothetical protein